MCELEKHKFFVKEGDGRVNFDGYYAVPLEIAKREIDKANLKGREKQLDVLHEDGHITNDNYEFHLKDLEYVRKKKQKEWGEDEM